MLTLNWNFRYLPTYRLSQDPEEAFFGSVRQRLGCNDNPTVLQLEYSVRGGICFKLNTCLTGNAAPQELLQDSLHHERSVNVNMQDSGINELEEDGLDMDSELFNRGSSAQSLTLFVENVVVHIAGFVGRRLTQLLSCPECQCALINNDSDSIQFREDFFLLMQKDRGGLFRPSDDLTRVCKIVEKVIREEQSKGLSSLSRKRIEIFVKQECIGKDIFMNLHHNDYVSSTLRLSSLPQEDHKWNLVSSICKLFTKTRLNFVANTATKLINPVSIRSRCNKAVHFTGC